MITGKDDNMKLSNYVSLFFRVHTIPQLALQKNAISKWRRKCPSRACHHEVVNAPSGTSQTRCEAGGKSVQSWIDRYSGALCQH